MDLHAGVARFAVCHDPHNVAAGLLIRGRVGAQDGFHRVANLGQLGRDDANTRLALDLPHLHVQPGKQVGNGFFLLTHMLVCTGEPAPGKLHRRLEIGGGVRFSGAIIKRAGDHMGTG